MSDLEALSVMSKLVDMELEEAFLISLLKIAIIRLPPFLVIDIIKYK